MEKTINYLEEEKPLITIPINKLKELTKIGEKYNWEITKIKENLYRAPKKTNIYIFKPKKLISSKKIN